MKSRLTTLGSSATNTIQHHMFMSRSKTIIYKAAHSLRDCIMRRRTWSVCPSVLSGIVMQKHRTIIHLNFGTQVTGRLFPIFMIHIMRITFKI